MVEIKYTEQKALLKDEIHIWYGCIKQSKNYLHVFKRMITDDEQKRAQEFYFPKDQSSFIVGRGMLRTILAHYLEIDPTNIQINYGKYGKPFLGSNRIMSDIQFNLSHSENMVVIAVSLGRNVGVDIEKIRNLSDLDKLIATICSQREKDHFKQLTDVEKILSLFRCWTRKEAYLKAISTGMNKPMDQLTVSLESGDRGQVFTIYDDLKGYSQYMLKSIPSITGYEAALCAKKLPCTIHYSWWQPQLLEN